MSDVKPNPCPACGNEPKQRYESEYYCSQRGCWLAESTGALPLEYWNRLRLAPVASDETIPVRIAVVVDEHGNWGAGGNSDASAPRMKAAADRVGATTGRTRTTFVTALAYKPQPQPAMEVIGDSESQ